MQTESTDHIAWLQTIWGMIVTAIGGAVAFATAAFGFGRMIERVSNRKISPPSQGPSNKPPDMNSSILEWFGAIWESLNKLREQQSQLHVQLFEHDMKNSQRFGEIKEQVAVLTEKQEILAQENRIIVRRQDQIGRSLKIEWEE